LKGSTGLRSPERKLATNDLKLAGAALTGRQATTKKSAAVASPLARLQSAAGYVNAAGAIDVGTAVQVSDRTVAAVPLALGQDLDIAGGAGPSKSVPAVAVARQDAVSAVLKHAGGGGGGSLQQQAADGLQPGSVDELSEVDRLRALGAGDFGTAASRVAAVAALDVGTGLQVTARTADLLPMMVGGDFDIAGGGAELLQQPASTASK
jgi:hypothetical protein